SEALGEVADAFPQHGMPELVLAADRDVTHRTWPVAHPGGASSPSIADAGPARPRGAPDLGRGSLKGSRSSYADVHTGTDTARKSNPRRPQGGRVPREGCP